MNIFYTNNEPKQCAIDHMDKHVCKMMTEYAQLLCTAHRVLDGKQFIDDSSGRKIKRWKLDNPIFDTALHKATHINHPSAVWCRQSKENYLWLVSLMEALCKEYTYRYGKIYKGEREGLLELLKTPPNNLKSTRFTEPTPAMPDECKVPGDSIMSYRNYYISNKQRMASWSGKVNSRNAPVWFKFIESQNDIRV